MGLDSVELVLAWEESFGVKIPDAEAQVMLTPASVIDWIYEKLRTDQPEDIGSLTLRAFLRLRGALMAEGVLRADVRLDEKISNLLPGKTRRDLLGRAYERAGFSPLRRLPFGLQFTFGRVQDIVSNAVIYEHAMLRVPGHAWSRRQVREVVRAVIFAQLALRKFSDEAEFVKDLGVD